MIGTVRWKTPAISWRWRGAMARSAQSPSALPGGAFPIAVLPVGTANNISKVLGLADTTPERLIAGWATARRIGFDTGLVDGPWGATRFIEGFGVGLLARAITELDAKAEVAFGRVDNREEKITSGLKRLRDLLENCPAEELKISLGRPGLVR